jgi:hypothetical protein
MWKLRKEKQAKKPLLLPHVEVLAEVAAVLLPHVEISLP